MTERVHFVILAAALCFAGRVVTVSTQGRDQQRVRILREAKLYILPDESRVPLATLAAGTTVEIFQMPGQPTAEGWTQVAFQDPVWGRRIGYVRSDLLSQPPAPSGSPAPPTQPRAAPPTQPAAAPPAPAVTERSPVTSKQPPIDRQTRVRQKVHHNGAFLVAGATYVPTNLTFTDSTTVSSFLEKAQLTADYRVGTGVGFEAGGGTGVGKHFVVGGVVTWRQRNDSASVTQQIPHPFFYNRLTTLSGQAGDLTRDEIAAHLQFGWLVPFAGRAQIVIGAGPSLFRIRQPIVTEVTYASDYPYDVVNFASAKTTTESKTGVGFHGQFELSVQLAGPIAVQTTGRYSDASVKFESAEGNSFNGRAGGFQVGAGLRLQF